MNLRHWVASIYYLGIKELFSLRYDTVLLILIVYSFTYAVLGPAKGAKMELINASVALVDEDRSALSSRIRDALQKPYFLPARQLSLGEIDDAMDADRYTFAIDIPPDFQADALAGRKPTIQVNVDATAMSQAGRGAGYIQSVITQETATFLHIREADLLPRVALVTRAKFNPNLMSPWFVAVMQLVNNITMLAIILSGAALVREREHGTIEHLLVMPLTPAQIMLAKVWANGLVIVVVATVSLRLVVQWLLDVPVAGSLPLFMFSTFVYMFSVTSLGIFLATIARSMPQFGLLAFPVFIVMNLLSGGTTPLDSMPDFLQKVMLVSPTTHFVNIAQAILYRGAGLDAVWPSLAAVAAIGVVFFVAALMRFRRTVTAMQA
ncbi:MAG TPA: ABC transporter permease [Acetobacteraceae bacterium]|nr:ABC transporter permease [Acetobacteraceae bacterium]